MVRVTPLGIDRFVVVPVITDVPDTCITRPAVAFELGAAAPRETSAKLALNDVVELSLMHGEDEHAKYNGVVVPALLS